MGEKTLAEIARAAWMNAGNLEDHWEITAAAVRKAVMQESLTITNIERARAIVREWWKTTNNEILIELIAAALARAEQRNINIADHAQALASSLRDIVTEIQAYEGEDGPDGILAPELKAAIDALHDYDEDVTRWKLDGREHNEMPVGGS